MNVIKKVHVELVSDGEEEIQDRIYDCKSAYPFLKEKISRCTTENMIIVCMDNDYSPICYDIMAKGTANKVVVDKAEIGRMLLLTNSRFFIMAHNHIGKSLEPSNSDIETTREIGQIGKLFDIELIDSIIINSLGDYHSIRMDMLKKVNE